MRNMGVYSSLAWRRTQAKPRFVLAVALLSLAIAGYLLYTLITSAMTWTAARLDDLHYGYPRTFQTDGLLTAHGSPVHIIVQNVRGRVWIVVLPKDNLGCVVAIKGPQWLGSGGDLVPATVTLQDVNHDGRADLVLHVGDRTFVYLQDAQRRSFVLEHGHPQGEQS